MTKGTPSITCPRCERTSHNPNDVREGYCGACHQWTSALPVTLWLAWDERVAAYLYGESEQHYIHILPMLYTHRVALTPKHDLSFYETAWCFPDLISAIKACDVWRADPLAVPEPPGAIRRIDW